MDKIGEDGKVTTYTNLTATSFVVASVDSGRYSYRVQAVCEEGTSEWSDWMYADIASAISEELVDDSMGEETVNDQCFDLYGCRLQHLPKHGIFVRNGRKRIAR